MFFGEAKNEGISIGNYMGVTLVPRVRLSAHTTQGISHRPVSAAILNAGGCSFGKVLKQMTERTGVQARDTRAPVDLY
jgi:hypothetical protein